MAERYSTHLKAVLLMEDLTVGELKFSQQECLTIQDFSYRCDRGKNEEGIIGGLTGSSMMQMTVRLHELSENKQFYDCLISRVPSPFTIVFNADFDQDGKLKEYENAMTVFGYVVDVLEHFDTRTPENGSAAPMNIRVEIQLSSMVFHGKDEDRVLEIIRS